MYTFVKRNRLAFLCAAGIVFVGGCFLIYKASMKNKMLNEEYEETKENVIKKLIGMGLEEKEIREAMENVKDPTNVEEISKYLVKQAQNQTFDPNYGIEKNNIVIDKSINKFPVKVFVRIRPLIKEEIESKHKEIEYNTKTLKKTKSVTLNINDITKKVRKSAIKQSKNKNKNKIPIKKFKGFANVLTKTDNNHILFEKTILPSINNIFLGNTVCMFAYGHTGSGKTHTILGYDDQISPGMYSLTIKYICHQLEKLQNKILISCKFAELYQGKMRDLFGDLVECHVREDDNGNINIRGPTIKDDATGKVSVQPLTSVYINENEADKLILKVKESLKFRNVGSSTLHDESSRSHVFLELELVTNELIEARNELLIAEANVVPIGKERDDVKILIQSKQFIRDETTGQYKMDLSYEPPKDVAERYEWLGKEFKRLDGIVNDCMEKVQEIENDELKENECITGSIIFVDLAGNEYGSDAKMKKKDSIQLSERKEINKSLLSLKECVRALHSHKTHVPYRDSKLTMVLRPHLKGINSTAIMIANVSPSQEHINKTYNTLLYAQLVAKA